MSGDENNKRGRVPLPQLNTGDSVVTDAIWFEEFHRDETTLTLKRMGGPGLRSFTAVEFWKEWEAGRLTIVRRESTTAPHRIARNAARAFDGFSKEQQAEMLRRLDYVTACERFFGRRLYTKRPDTGFKRIAKIVARYRRGVAAKQAKKKTSQLGLESVSGSTLRDWWKLWCLSGRRIGALAPNTDKRGSRETTIDKAVVKIIEETVWDSWMVPERPPLTIVHDLICSRVGDLPFHHEPPSESTVRRWIADNIDEYTQTFYRWNKEEADHRFRVTRNVPVPTLPLEVVEFDDTPLDLMLVDENGANPKRAYLTAAKCILTGMVTGWYLGPEAPSYVTVMKALLMSIKSKDDIVHQAGCMSAYPVLGVPAMIKVDNGPGYRSLSLAAACGQLQIDLRYVPVKKPKLKGKIERFFGEVSRDFCSIFPGRTFSNVEERGDYDSEGNARMMLPQARLLFARWVVDIHHNRPNARSFGQTPLQRWNSFSGAAVRMPPEASDLLAMTSLIVNRTIGPDGVHFMGLLFGTTDELMGLKRTKHLGQAWLVKVNPEDISRIFILNEETESWETLTCRHPKLVEDLTLGDWIRVAKAARARTAAGQRVARATLLQAREDLFREAEAYAPRRRAKPREYTREEMDQFEKEVESPDYDLLIDPDDDEEAERVAARRRRSSWKRQRTENGGAPADPARTANVSSAGGHPLGPQVDPEPIRTAAEAAAEDLSAADDADEIRLGEAAERLKADIEAQCAGQAGEAAVSAPLAPDIPNDPMPSEQAAINEEIRRHQDDGGEIPLVDEDDADAWTTDEE